VIEALSSENSRLGSWERHPGIPRGTRLSQLAITPGARDAMTSRVTWHLTSPPTFHNIIANCSSRKFLAALLSAGPGCPWASTILIIEHEFMKLTKPSLRSL
jgi:hypothetical protein